MLVGVDLYSLWRAGRVELPALAGVYRRAGQGLFDVRHDDADWCAVRDRLAATLRDAQNCVEETAGAVCLAVEEYARADGGARNEFDRLRRESGWGPR
ncbi:hypothetical protein GCM10022255_087350 [Dactylosporangium darangshiense]|uniref:Uncharacterized protein n=1 Tax=Dactylosporangium darangshiense TaxID=579108 RepID=A0ABP8DN33_9ACTN